MSEVIEDYIREHPGMSENEAFEGFAAQERIHAWMGNDATRRDRLRREFARVWMQIEGKAASAGPAAMVQPRPLPAPVPQRQPEPQPVPITRSPAPAPAPAQASASARHLKVLCTTCETMQVWADGPRIRCRHCGHEYHDMLELVPVKPVGFFTYTFGEGAAGWLAAGGVLALLILLYVAATRF